jgi:hypothetical protein
MNSTRAASSSERRVARACSRLRGESYVRLDLTAFGIRLQYHRIGYRLTVFNLTVAFGGRPRREEGLMSILRIEHPVLNYDAWKRAFDSDPVGRAKSGVRRFEVHRAVDDPNYVLIDLEFDSPGQAEALLARMRTVWERVQGSLITDPRARIVETVERAEY